MAIDKELNEILESGEDPEIIGQKLKKLVKDRPDINLNEEYTEGPRTWHTPFSWFAMQHNIPIAQALLDLGVRTNDYPPADLIIRELTQWHKLRQTSGASPQELKAILNFVFFMSETLRDPNELDTDNMGYKNNHLMSLLVLESYAIVKSLILNYASEINNDYQDIEGKTFITLATKMNRTEIVQLLLKLCGDKVNLNMPDHEGNTPLHYAAAYGNKDLIKAFLLHGAKKDIRNRKGQTPFDMLSIGRAEILKLFRSVSVNASRDLYAENNDPPVYLPGRSKIYPPEDELFGENADINTWQYLQSVLDATPGPTKEELELISSVRSNYSGISLVDSIMQQKKDLKPLLELFETIVPAEKKEKAASKEFMPHFASASAGDTKSERDIPEYMKKSAATMAQSCLFGSILAMTLNEKKEEVLYVDYLGDDNNFESIKETGAEVFDEVHRKLFVSKDLLLKVMGSDIWMEKFLGKSLWDALREEVGDESVRKRPHPKPQ